jgi:hypothetical protein
MERIDHYFEGVAWKYLAAVDAERNRSNQHEIGGLVKAGFKKHLGDPGSQVRRWPTKFLYLADDEDESVSAFASTSWYDSRRENPKRHPELRLYYKDNAVTELIGRGMFMLIAKTKGDELLIVFAEAGSSGERQLRWLFGLNGTSELFSVRTIDPKDERSSWSAIWILAQLGIEPEPADDNWLGIMLDRFDGGFPTTREFSKFARMAAQDINVIESPDDTVVSLMEMEERLFRLLERHIVGQQLSEGFQDVETFISYSLSVQNRRKSRAGYAFENHLEHIFTEHGIQFERGAYTEGRSKPDFLFPGREEYRDHDFPVTQLSMLGVKSSCKERWRQVLTEASRIPIKHLATLEPGISPSQIFEMKANKLQLVVPSSLRETYTPDEQPWLCSVADFIRHVREQQSHV